MQGRRGLIVKKFIIASYLLMANSHGMPTSITGADQPMSTKDRSFELIGSLGAGYGAVFGSDYSDPIHGTHYLFSGGTSYRLSRWALDGSLGWFYNRINGTTNGNEAVRMRTRAGVIELNPRYLLSKHWQLGPVVDILFGSDTSFAPKQNGGVVSAFGGLKAAYEWQLRNFDLRVWQQVSTDLSIGSRQSVFTVLGLQVGLPVSLKKHVHQQATHEMNEESVMISGIEKSENHSSEVRISLDPQKIFFGTNSARVRPKVAKVLSDVGKYLASVPDQWEELDVAGHADQRGSFRYNLKLSSRRAESVVNSLWPHQQVDVLDKVKRQGFSFSQPLDHHSNPIAWAKNRRVELRFGGVKDPKSLREKLNAFKSLISEPTVQ